MERGIYKLTTETLTRLLGPASPSADGKLAAVRGALVIEPNYGLALDPEPRIMPFHDVTKCLAALRKANGGKPVRVLRKGMLIRIRDDKFDGIWRIRSLMNDARKGLLMDLSAPQMIPYRERGKSWCIRDVSIKSALRSGLEILPQRYTGHPLKD